MKQFTVFLTKFFSNLDKVFTANLIYKTWITLSWEQTTKLQITETKVNKLLLVTQGVGAVFVAVFLAAYLGGLPSTDVLHSEPAFRIPLMVFGAVLLVLVLANVILAAYHKRN